MSASVRRPWTLVMTGPGRPSRSIRLGVARLAAATLLLCGLAASSLWLGWQLGEVTRLF